MWSDERRSSGNGDAAEWRDAARRGDDRRGDLASDLLHSERAGEDRCAIRRKCATWEGTFLWAGGLLHVSHDSGKGRTVGTGPDRDRLGSIHRLHYRVATRSQPASGARNFLSDE